MFAIYFSFLISYDMKHDSPIALEQWFLFNLEKINS